MTLRPATPGDAAALARFAREAFDAAFGHLYQPEDLATFFAEARTEEKYRADLFDPSRRAQLAVEDGSICAYALIVMGQQFEERPAPQPKRPVFLSQLYCAAETTGKGIGTELMKWVVAEARHWGADAIQLSVYSENFGAQRFYERHGFTKVADIEFWVGNHRDDELLYELAL